jgi:TP901 family phage tail tape measure protein
MASLSTVVELIFNGVNNASSAIGQVAGDLGKLDGKVQGLAEPFADLANSLLKAEAAILGLGAAFMVLAVKETIAFQDSLGLVEKQLGDSGVTIDQARLDIEAFGLTYGINANKVAESTAGFLAAGYDYEVAARLVATSTQLMIAGELDAAFAVEAINKSLAGFRIPANEAADSATKVGDILNKIGDISSGKFEAIVEGFSRISPTAKDAGLSMEETAAIIASLVDIFGSGEIAATALKSGLLSLLVPSKEASETLADLGVKTTGSNGELLQSKDILESLAGKWNGLTDAQKQQTAAIIFGKEQAGAMSAVLGDWAKVQDYVNQLVDENTGAVGSMAREVEGKLAAISSSVERAGESWRQFVENFGARLTGDPEGNIQGVIDAAGNMGIAFKAVVTQGGFDPLLNLVQTQAGELENILNTVAKNLPEAFEGLDWTGLIDSLQGLQGEVGELFRAFFGEIDLTTVEGLTSALQTVMNTFETLTRVVTGIISEFRPFAAMIGETVRSFNELDDASKLEFGQTLGGMKLLVDTGTGLGLALIALGRAGVDMGEALDIGFGAAKVAVNALQITFDAVILKYYELKKAWMENKIRDEDTPWGNKDRLNEYKQELAEIELKIEAVTANLDRNGQEFDEGAAKIENAGNKTEEMRTKLEAGEVALNKIGKAAKDAGEDFKQLSGDVEDTIAAVEETIDGLKDIKLTLPEFEPIELPDLDFNFNPEDFGGGNPFEAATDGLDAFRNAAENFGMDGFSDKVKAAREAAEAESQRIQSALEQAITGGNAGGYKVEINADGLATVTANAETLKTGFQQLDGTIRTTADGYQYVEAKARLVGTGMSLLADGTIVASQAAEQTGRYFHQLGPAFQGASKEATALEKAQKALGDAFGSGGADVGKITGALNEYMGALGKSGALTVDQFINLTEVVNDYKVAMEEIASNERIKNIEFAVQLKTAQLETDMERVKAAFASIDSTIQSTGELLGSLFGNLTDTTDRYKELEIQEQIDLENKRRQEALDIQKKLAEAEIARIEAQTRALNRGDALIKIQGDGLEPELEAFMWKILSKIRARANTEFSDYLLGMGVGA